MQVELDDIANVFGQRDEAVRPEQPQYRMAPAHQRFEADQVDIADRQLAVILGMVEQALQVVREYLTLVQAGCAVAVAGVEGFRRHLGEQAQLDRLLGREGAYVLAHYP